MLIILVLMIIFIVKSILDYGDILDLLKLDVMCINIYKDGLMIRVTDKAATKKSLEQYDLVNKLEKSFRK